MKYFVTGIGTEIGKTVVSTILTEKLNADYWKPIQAGELDFSDTMKVKKYISNKKSHFFEERYKLLNPMSPHAAAKIEDIKINLNDFELPETNNKLIIEGAGGLMVPINHNGDMIIDIIHHLNIPVIIVSKNYLGSINHTLLTIKALQNLNIPIKGIIFNGEENLESQKIIQDITNINILGRIEEYTSDITNEWIIEQTKNIEL